MIKSFKHKGLKRFFDTGSTSGIQAAHSAKIEDRLKFLDTAQTIKDLNKPGYRLHELIGERKGTWSICVSGNWRITFEFTNGNVEILNYEDYH